MAKGRNVCAGRTSRCLLYHICRLPGDAPGPPVTESTEARRQGRCAPRIESAAALLAGKQVCARPPRRFRPFGFCLVAATTEDFSKSRKRFASSSTERFPEFGRECRGAMDDFSNSRKCFAARSTGWFFDIVHSTIHPFQLTHANRSRPCLVEEGAEHFRVLDGIPWLDRSRSEARRAARGRQARLNAVIPWLIYGVARDLCVQRRGLSASRQSRLRDSTASGPFSVFRVRGTGGVPRLK